MPRDKWNRNSVPGSVQQFDPKLRNSATSVCAGKHVGHVFGDVFSCNNCRYICKLPYGMHHGGEVRVDSSKISKRVFDDGKRCLTSSVNVEGGEYKVAWNWIA